MLATISCLCRDNSILLVSILLLTIRAVLSSSCIGSIGSSSRSRRGGSSSCCLLSVGRLLDGNGCARVCVVWILRLYGVTNVRRQDTAYKDKRESERVQMIRLIDLNCVAIIDANIGDDDGDDDKDCVSVCARALQCVIHRSRIVLFCLGAAVAIVVII